MESLEARLAFLLEVFRSLSLIGFASATLLLIAPAMLDAQTNGSLVTSRIIQSIDENARVPLKGNVRQDLATWPDFGLVEDGKPLHLYLLLQRTEAQQADLDNLIARQQQPTAPEYHKWLTPKKFGARFGGSPEDIAKITGWLESHGFQVRSVLNNASMIDFAATAGQVRDTFHAELHYFNVRGGKYVANVGDPQIPAALVPVVAGIKGLIKIPAHTNHTPIRQASYDAHSHRWHTVDSAGKAVAKPAFDDDADGDLDVTPQDFYTIYNVNPVFTGGHLAGTATVAVIEESDMEYGTVSSTTGVATGGDVATFRRLFGVPGTLNMHVYHGYGKVTCNDPGIDPDGTGEDEEASLDAEWINATAPSANLIFVSCDQSPDNGIFSSMAALVDNSLSDAMSLSYGESELFLVASDYTAQDTLYAQAATQGQSIFISSGDSGSDVADQNTNGTATSGINVNAFGSPLVTVAGGTDFSDYYDASEGGRAQSTYWSSTNTTHYGSALGYIPETAWNDSCASSILANLEGGFIGAGYCASEGAGNDGFVIGGSGGISTHYAAPAWQTGISGYSNSNHAQPDIAGFASNGWWGHALIFCDSNPIDASFAGCTTEANFGEAGGTSFVAPYMAGVAGLLRDYTGSRQGLLNPALYALAKAQFTAAATKTACYSNGQTSNAGVTTGLPAADCIFNDVTTSNNDVPCEVGSTSCFVNSGESFGMLSLKGSSSLSVAYPSTIGFDQVSGIGTVNVNNVITKWNTAFTSTTGLKASPTSITSSQSTELTATVTGGTPIGYLDTPPALTGKARFAAGSTSLGNCTLSAGTCSLSVPGTALQSGANSVTATFLGSGTYPSSTSGVVTVTVTASSGPAVTLAPTSLNFGTVATGVTSPAEAVTLKNSGNASLTITAIALTGTNSGDFLETTTCTSSLAAGASCTIKVQFKPSAIGARRAAVSITDNAAGNPQQVPLSGTGTTAELSPTSLSFGTLAVGLTSAVKTVTLKNVGTTAITITSIAVTGAEAGDFLKTATTCGSSLAAAASCTVSVTFKPTTGFRTANLTFTDNASGSPQQVPLGGTGTTAELTPTSLSFGTLAVGLTSAVKTVTLKNVGTTAITITSIAVTGAEAGDFLKTATTCGSSLAAAASCTVSVTFKPTTTGFRTANLTFTDNASGSPQQVLLGGTGTTAELTPSSLSFGTLAVGLTSAVKTVTLKNVGTTAITITSIAVTGAEAGDFPKTATTCGSSLAAAASCTVSVTFKPTTTGTRSANLTFTDNASGSPQQVSLSGTGS